MRFSFLLSTMFFFYTNTAFADIAEPEGSEPASEEDTGKEAEEEGGCNTVQMSDLTLILLPVIGLAVASRRR